MGYDPLFIEGLEVPLPELRPGVLKASYDDGRVLDHSRFSLVFQKERGLAVYTAHNIDGANLIEEGVIKRKDDFRRDPLVDDDLQIDNNRGYHKNPWDRGHMVRRASLHWGDLDEAKTADSESYFWTNIAPQHTKLHHGPWGKIEDWMVAKADDHQRQVCVFTGPIFTPWDILHKNKENEEPIYIPAGFWKILVISFDLQLKAAGFLVWQVDFAKERPVKFDPHMEQIRITTLEYILGLTFGPLRDADPLRFLAGTKRGRGVRKGRDDGYITDIDDILL